MKYFRVLLLAVLLVLSMSTMAFADDVTEQDPAQDFMNSLNDGTIENAGNILNESINDLDGLTQPNGFVSFLSEGLSWVPTEIWTVFTLSLVLCLVRLVSAFLWR